MREILKIVLSFLIIIFNFNIINFAKTNTIKEVKITIDIKDDGTAQVTELWKTDICLGTELYHSFENLEENAITNFCVYEDGIKYKQKKEWDVARNTRR